MGLLEETVAALDEGLGDGHGEGLLGLGEGVLEDGADVEGVLVTGVVEVAQRRQEVGAVPPAGVPPEPRPLVVPPVQNHRTVRCPLVVGVPICPPLVWGGDRRRGDEGRAGGSGV